MIGIYLIENKITGKKYIGQSIDIERRWKQHISSSKNIKCSSYYNPLYKDFRHYGIDNFIFKVVEITTKEKLDDRELYWMKQYNTLQDGYNIMASLDQCICLEDTRDGHKEIFRSFVECENYLHAHNITKGLKLKNFLLRAIHSKNTIYGYYKIYYWR